MSATDAYPHELPISTPALQRNIADFYDRSSPLWERAWGEHMHHGYYGPDGTLRPEPRQAQVDLIDEIVRWAGVAGPRRVLDVGCGVGGTSLYLAQQTGARVEGITLSPVQAARARERAAAAGLSAATAFHTADALTPPLAPASFDLVWSLESGEHMPAKERFVAKCFELLEPGGRFVLVTWCHREVPPGLSQTERAFLRSLYSLYHLPYVLSVSQYARIMEDSGFREVKTADWTPAVAPFWREVARATAKPGNIAGVLQAGWPTVKGAVAVLLMLEGYRRGLLRYGLLTGVKP